MIEEQHIGSILLADCGTVMTKAVLLEQVAGQYRFIAQGKAPTTTEYPWGDVSEGIRHAVEQIAQVTGRRFFDGSGDLIIPESPGRQGVDAFAATSSASEPLDVVLGGMVRDLSIASAQRAAAGTYSLVKAILAGDDKGQLSEEDYVQAIHKAKPDAICIAGGIDKGATTPVLELVKTITLACSMMDASIRPRLLYAGNAQLRERIVQVIKGQTELRVADNVRPTLTKENLSSAQEELNALYVHNKMGLLPGIDVVNSWSSVPLIPTGSALGQLIEYLGHLSDSPRGILGVDVGAANTTVGAVFDKQSFLTIYGGLGTAFGSKQLVQEHGIESITRWLPEAMSDEEIQGFLINKEMRPVSIHQETRELRLEQALTREAIRTTLRIARPGWEAGNARPYPHLMPLCDTIIIGGGALANTLQPGQAALVALDALEPIGITTLVLDMYGMMPALGNVAAIKPLATVETLDSGALVNLATVVTPVAGHARRGDVILKVKVTYDDGSALNIEVEYGNLEVLPLPPGQQAELELSPVRRFGFDVGLGGPGKSGKRQVSGGLAGLIIDARGRPLRLARDPERRQNQIRQWLWDVGG
ncbi:MAG: hypothetical protein GY832_10410 [Chloroflexi bacterium]|nr:hypothetical protein [Chloroflexota bacterium]